MKAMGIANVVNFPFPTAPDRSNLKAAEKLLIHLGAIEASSNRSNECSGAITPLGRLLSKFPVSPRFGKM
jgi:ATP-dependent RNA helicase DHX37/DHR1